MHAVLLSRAGRRTHAIAIAAFAVIAVAMTANFALAQPDDYPASHFRGKRPVPDNVRVTLSADAEEFFLGENVLVHFTMENTGGETFQAEFGGDYRGAWRALRYVVTASDPQGHEVPDPYPNSGHMYMGGLGGPVDVTPEKPFHDSLPITRYLRIENPGRYVIRVKHLSGWKDTPERPIPSAEITLTFMRPTEEHAQELVQKWLNEPKHNGTLRGTKSTPYADFSQIRDPVYLRALAAAARASDEKGIIGVGSIPTPEATRVLLELVNTLEGKPHQTAAREMRVRLPDPTLRGEFQVDPHQSMRDGYRVWLIDRGWDGSLTDEVRETGRRFLESEDAERVAIGAYMIECAGTPEDAPQIVAALDRQIPKTNTLEREPGEFYPRARRPCWELLRAARALQVRGAAIPEHPTTPGEAILFLAALKHDEAFRPAGWQDECVKLLESDIRYLQEQTLIHLPSPMPAELHPYLATVLKAGDIEASIAACQIIREDKLAEFGPLILETLRTAEETWLFGQADYTAVELGLDFERLEISADRLDDTGLMFDCFRNLLDIFDNAGGGGGRTDINLSLEGRRIKPLWKALIAKHADYLRAGGKLSLPHEDVTPEFFPKDYHVNLKGTRQSFPATK